MRRPRLLRAVLPALAAALIAPGPAAALVIHASASMTTAGQDDGVVVSGGQYVGAAFSLSERWRALEIGGHLVAASDGVEVFGALIPMVGPLPAAPPAAIESLALAHATLAPPLGSADIRADIDVILEPGDYALVFGSGAFDTGGLAYLAQGGTPDEDAAFFYSNAGDWVSGGLSSARLVVEGELAPPDPEPDPGSGASAVPLPGAGGMGLAALAALAALRLARGPGRAAGPRRAGV